MCVDREVVVLVYQEDFEISKNLKDYFELTLLLTFSNRGLGSSIQTIP
jgi:hypothetical protein